MRCHDVYFLSHKVALEPNHYSVIFAGVNFEISSLPEFRHSLRQRRRRSAEFDRKRTWATDDQIIQLMLVHEQLVYLQLSEPQIEWSIRMDQVDCIKLLGFCLSNKVDIGVLIAVLIFVAGLFANSYVERRKNRNELLKTKEVEYNTRRRYLIALSEEIGLNVQSLEKFVAKFPSTGKMSDFLRADKNNRPVITFTFSQTFFQNRTEVIDGLSEIIIRNIVEFYGKMAELSLDCESIDYSGFTTISNDGREALLLDLKSETQIAFQQGKSLRDAIMQHLLDSKR